jgi:hypothetical protein
MRCVRGTGSSGHAVQIRQSNIVESHKPHRPKDNYLEIRLLAQAQWYLIVEKASLEESLILHMSRVLRLQEASPHLRRRRLWLAKTLDQPFLTVRTQNAHLGFYDMDRLTLEMAPLAFYSILFTFPQAAVKATALVSRKMVQYYLVGAGFTYSRYWFTMVKPTDSYSRIAGVFETPVETLMRFMPRACRRIHSNSAARVKPCRRYTGRAPGNRRMDLRPGWRSRPGCRRQTTGECAPEGSNGRRP